MRWKVVVKFYWISYAFLQCSGAEDVNENKIGNHVPKKGEWSVS